MKVIQAQNLHSGDAEPYAALSYCWGQDQVLKTTSVNKTEVEDGLPLTLLPKTITDAIRVTRKLGIKLLWVDSLCLVQDEEEEVAKEIAKMHHYYGNAYITISAVVAASCTEGFLQDHPEPELPNDSFYLPVELGVPERPSYLKLVHYPYDRDPKPIHDRAWTLQEALLSHRLVSFGSRFISWSCRTDSYGTEDDSLDGVYRNLAAVHGPGNTGWLSEHHSALSKLKAWSNVVRAYTVRSLSKQRDKLPAISGVASVLLPTAPDVAEPEYQLNFLAGFLVQYPIAHPPSTEDSSPQEVKYQPQGHFESFLFAVQLVWGDHSWKHNPPGFEHEYSAVVERRKRRRQKSRPSPYIAPTWSWASHLGPVYPSSPEVIEFMSEHELTKASWRVWEEGVRIQEVCVSLSSSDAPLGALTGATLTLNGYIFRLEEEQARLRTICADDGRNIAPGDCEGLFCLEIMPAWLEPYFSGIVLEPVGPEGRFRNGAKVYRRFGIYALENPDYYDTTAELSGTFETITII